MGFSGCDRCGVADNDNHLPWRTIDGRRVRLCPECGRPMRRVTVAEALELARERDEAERWRAAAALPVEPGAVTPEPGVHAITDPALGPPPAPGAA